MKSQPCVIYHPENGVFLGNFIGLGIWSKLDPAGQEAAITFKNKVEAEAFIKTWESGQEGVQLVSVTPDSMDFASIEACVAAGLPAWAPTGELETTRIPSL